MRIRLVSDLHVEFDPTLIAPTEHDKETVLVNAGDLAPLHADFLYQRHMVDASVRFRDVIAVLGNHEYYNGYLETTLDTARRLIARINDKQNIHLLENETKVIDGVAFIGATLWTNYDYDPVKALQVSRALNDFRLIWPKIISPSRKRVSPDDFVDMFEASRKYVFEQVKIEKAKGNKTVVVVHHGVSPQSTHPRYAGDPINAGFVSDLTEDILDAQPDYIFHGHVHDAFDYMIGNTRIIANPRGYPGREQANNGFNPTLTIEV